MASGGAGVLAKESYRCRKMVLTCFVVLEWMVLKYCAAWRWPGCSSGGAQRRELDEHGAWVRVASRSASREGWRA